jgi:hypothetical protein
MRTIQVKINCGKKVCGKCDSLSWDGDCAIFDEQLGRVGAARYYRCDKCLQSEVIKSDQK